MSKDYCKGTKPEPPRPDTKKLPDKCADLTNCDIGPQMPEPRADCARKIRVAAADFERAKPIPGHPCNCDEVRYENQNFFASFTKGLKKVNHFGEVDPDAYCKLLQALRSGKPQDFEAIPLGCMAAAPAVSADVQALAAVQEADSRFGSPAAAPGTAPVQRRLVNPQAALAFDLEGSDSHHLRIPPAPEFASEEEAGEMIELYWQALARDVHFSDYDTNGVTKDAAKELSGLSTAAFTGPRIGGQVTAQTLFRNNTPGELDGPYLSQFMLLPIPFGSLMIDARNLTVRAKHDYMTSEDDWLLVQKGCAPPEMEDITRRLYIRNGRDLSQYVHIDVLYQAYFNAMLILLTLSAPSSGGAGLGAPFDANNPYNPAGGGTPAFSKTQDGFGTFGGPHIAALLPEVATRALKAVWYQKWSVHRRLRPEEFGGRVHFDLTKQRSYPFSDLVRNSQVVKDVFAYNKKQNKGKGGKGTYLLPMAFPEGSPIHPAYGAGHATVAGACVTLLKAWFREPDTNNPMTIVDLLAKNPLCQKAIKDHRGDGNASGMRPVVATASGKGLDNYKGKDADKLTVEGELNKLAANVGIGRNHAGVHWRTDHTASIQLGEQVAISLLEDGGFTYNENFDGFTLVTFDGAKKTIGKKQKTPGCP